MRGSDFIKSLPKGGSRREKMIFDAVRRRNIAPIAWSEITTKDSAGNTATFKVSNDGLRIGEAGDSFRATVSHKTAQLVADDLGAVLPTPMLSDEIWKQAKIRVPALPHKSWADDNTMGNTARMAQQSALVDKKIAGRKGLAADVGKDWVNSNIHTTPKWGRRCGRPYCAINYGWHGAGLPSKAATLAGNTVWQPVASSHKLEHVDYSQVVRLIQRKVRLCDPSCREVDIQKVASDPKLSGLLSNEGPILLRHPGVTANCPVVGACPGVGTPIKKQFQNGKLPNGKAAIPCPDLDCNKPAGPEPMPPIAQASVASRLMPFVAGAAAGYFAVKVLLPRL